MKPSYKNPYYAGDDEWWMKNMYGEIHGKICLKPLPKLNPLVLKQQKWQQNSWKPLLKNIWVQKIKTMLTWYLREIKLWEKKGRKGLWN